MIKCSTEKVIKAGDCDRSDSYTSCPEAGCALERHRRSNTTKAGDQSNNYWIRMLRVRGSKQKKNQKQIPVR